MKKEDLFAGIANTQFDKPNGIDALELDPVMMPFDLLKEDVLKYIEENQGTNVLEEAHKTNWALPFGTKVEQHDIMKVSEKYQMLYSLVNIFPLRTSFRINIMGPNSGLKQHKETVLLRMNRTIPLNYIKVRFHLPITTNKGALALLNGQYYHFAAKKVYYFNNGAIHGAENRSVYDRIHIVWDTPLTESVFKMMFNNPKRTNPSYSTDIDKNCPTDGFYGVTEGMPLSFYPES